MDWREWGIDATAERGEGNGMKRHAMAERGGSGVG